MVKISKELIENKLKNPVYSEILYKINKKEIYLSDFAKKEFKGKKSFQILARQLSELQKEGFLKSRKQGRKIFYSISWKKITEEFIKILYKMALERDRYFQFYMKHSYMAQTPGGQIEVFRYVQGKQIHQLMLRESKRSDFINNPFLQGFFREVFSSLARQGERQREIYKQDINSVFNYIITMHIVDTPTLDYTGLIYISQLTKIRQSFYKRKDFSKREKHKISIAFDDLVKLKDDRDMILFTIFDPLMHMKPLLDIATPDVIKKNPDFHFLYDFLISLPMICFDVRQNQYLTTAFLSAQINSKEIRELQDDIIKQMFESGSFPKSFGSYEQYKKEQKERTDNFLKKEFPD